MERTARMLGPLSLVALGALAAVGCEDAYAPVSSPRVEASVLMHQELRQEDRFGLPAIATVFIPTDLRDAYNEAVPAGDKATFKSLVVARLMAFGQDAASANALAEALTPDLQPIDLTKPTGFLNGRKLDDDVITAELHLIFGSNAALNDDHVDANDKPLLPTFPYLAGPHLQ